MPSTVSQRPIDKSHALQPTKILYIRPGQGTIHSEALDLTPYLLSTYTDSITTSFQDSAQRVLRANPALQPDWRAIREHWYSNSNVKVFDVRLAGADGTEATEVANVHSPIMALGTTTIAFPPSSPHCTHKLIVTPVSALARAQSFVKDSIPHLWEYTDVSQTSNPKECSSRQISLYKADSVKRIEVARYVSDSGKFEVGGILVVEEREIDALVTFCTTLATLGQRDSFRMPREAS